MKEVKHQVFLTGFCSVQYTQDELTHILSERVEGFKSIIVPKRVYNGFAFLELTTEAAKSALLAQRKLEFFDHELIVKPVRQGKDLYKDRRETLERKVFVSNIPEKWSDYDLKECFSRFGGIEEAYIFKDKRNSCKKRKIGFAIFGDSFSAREVAKLRFVSFRGLKVSVEPAFDRREGAIGNVPRRNGHYGSHHRYSGKYNRVRNQQVSRFKNTNNNNNSNNSQNRFLNKHMKVRKRQGQNYCDDVSEVYLPKSGKCGLGLKGIQSDSKKEHTLSPPKPKGKTYHQNFEHSHAGYHQQLERYNSKGASNKDKQPLPPYRQGTRAGPRLGQGYANQSDLRHREKLIFSLRKEYEEILDYHSTKPSSSKYIAKVQKFEKGRIDNFRLDNMRINSKRGIGFSFGKNRNFKTGRKSLC